MTGNAGVEEDVRSFAEKVLECFGRVDVLINNACITHRGILSGCSFKEFNEVLRVGVSAPYLLNLFISRPFFPRRFHCEYCFHPRFHVPEGYGKL